MTLRSIASMAVWLPLTGCAVAAGGTVGLHYTTDGAVRVQMEVPLEVALVGSGTSAAEQGRPYVRGAVAPGLAYDVTHDRFDAGVRGAVGAVLGAGRYWLAPAWTFGAWGFNSKGGLDIGATLDVERAYGNDAACADLRYTNPVVPQVSVVRRTYNVDHPFAEDGGVWDVGIAAGVRHTRFLSCGGGTTARPPAP